MISYRNPSKSGKIMFWGLEGLGGILNVNIMKMTQKLRRIILLHLGLVAFRFHFGKTRKPIFK